MAIVVLDASVLIAHLDAEDAHHEASRAALEHAAEDELHLPASAYAEMLVQPSRTGHVDVVRTSLEALVVTVGAIDEKVAERAAALRAHSRSLRLRDALVLAYAEEASAARVLTTDRRWRRFPLVEVVR